MTGGSVDDIKLINSGNSEIAFSMVDAALDAYKGQDEFERARKCRSALMVLYPNRMHVVTIEGTGIEKCPTSKASACRPDPAAVQRKSWHSA